MMGKLCGTHSSKEYEQIKSTPKIDSSTSNSSFQRSLLKAKIKFIELDQQAIEKKLSSCIGHLAE